MSSDKDKNKNCSPDENAPNMEKKPPDVKENEDPHKSTERKADNLIQNVDKSRVDTLSSLVDNLCLGGETKKTEITINEQKQEVQNTVKIPDWLQDCETPFAWHLEQEPGLEPELVILRSLKQLDELLIDEPEFSLQRFLALLKLVLEYFIIGDIGKCCENMKIIDGCLEEEITRNDPLYQKVKLSLGHVVSATKAHVLYIIGKEEESKKIGRCIIPVKIMVDCDKAALSSMKARFFLYSGYENGEEVGVNYAREALELEPENAEWEYLLAKMLRQQRREVPFSTEVPRDELKLLENAVNRDKNPKYLVYLAQVYRECATQAFRQYRNHPNFRGELQSSVELMATRALEHYKEALSLCPDSPFVLRRVGYGIMNLPRKFADYDLALECLLKSLDISENQMTLHVLGTFYHRYGNDNRKALEYFERTVITGSHAGLSDMIRVKWILDPEYDPCPDFEIGLSWKMKKRSHLQLLAQLGGYHLFIKRDFYKAAEYFKQVIIGDKDSPLMKNFKSFFLRMNETIDLYKYLVNEALLLVQKHNSSSTVEPETSDEEEEAVQPANLGFVEDFLDLISEVHPELMETAPDPELIPKLFQASKEIEASWNQNNRGTPNFRGRGGRGNYPRSRGNRGGNYSGNRSHEDNERRGRFSVANQKEQGPEGDERRGGFSRGRGRGRGRGRNENWRQRPRNDDEDNKRDHENWRRK